MSSKRSTDVSSSAAAKKVKLTPHILIPDDIELLNFSISDEDKISLNLMYDEMFEDFFACLKKMGKDGEEKRIMLSMQQIEVLSSCMEKILLLIERYRESGRCVEFSFDLGHDVTAKLCSNGYTSLDIRRYFVKDGRVLPTKTGVHLNSKDVDALAEGLKKGQARIEEVQDVSSDILTKCQYVLLAREIHLMHRLNNPFCEGCQIDHPSQTKHMRAGGCMTEESSCWEEQVEYFFKEAYAGFDTKECDNLAEKYCKKHDIPLLRAVIKDESAADVKAFVLTSPNCSDKTYQAILDM